MKPSTRQELIEYCLRKLGHPVIEINVDEDQLEDRVDDAMQFFAEYHFDGVEKVYLKYQLQQKDINNGYISLTRESLNEGGLTSGNTFIDGTGLSGESSSRMTYTESGQSGYADIDSLIASVIKIFHFSTGTVNMFDVRYQYALNDLYTFGSLDLINYTVTQQYLSLLRDMLSPEKSIRFTRKNKKLYIDMGWKTMNVGDWVIIEAYRVLDAKVFPEVYNDMLLKKYLTALIKRQWGANLSKFNNIQLLGGVTFNGKELYEQAVIEIDEIEKTIHNNWTAPDEFFIG